MTTVEETPSSPRPQFRDELIVKDYEVHPSNRFSFPYNGIIKHEGDVVIFNNGSGEQVEVPMADLRSALLYVLHDSDLGIYPLTRTDLELEVPSPLQSDQRRILKDGRAVTKVTVDIGPSSLFELMEFVNAQQPFDQEPNNPKLMEAFRNEFKKWVEEDENQADPHPNKRVRLRQAIRNLQLSPDFTVGGLHDVVRASMATRGVSTSADTVPLSRPNLVPSDLQPEELFVDRAPRELVAARQIAGNLIGLLERRADPEKLQVLGFDPKEWDRLRSLAKTDRFNQTVLQELDERFQLLMKAQHPLVQQTFSRFMAEEKFRIGDPKMTRLRWELMEISVELNNGEFASTGEWIVHGDAQRDLKMEQDHDWAHQPEEDVYLFGLGGESKRKIPIVFDFRADEPTLYIEVDQASFTGDVKSGGSVTFVSNGKEVHVHILALRDAIQKKHYIVHPDGSMTMGCVGNKDNESHRNFLNTQADGQAFMQTVLRLQPKQIPTLRASLKHLMGDIRF